MATEALHAHKRQQGVFCHFCFWCNAAHCLLDLLTVLVKKGNQDIPTVEWNVNWRVLLRWPEGFPVCRSEGDSALAHSSLLEVGLPPSLSPWTTLRHLAWPGPPKMECNACSHSCFKDSLFLLSRQPSLARVNSLLSTPFTEFWPHRYNFQEALMVWKSITRERLPGSLLGIQLWSNTAWPVTLKFQIKRILF